MTGAAEDLDVAALEAHHSGPEDRAEQERLFTRCFKKQLAPGELAWRYDRNPVGRAVSLVYRPPGAEAVCSFAYMPRRALVFGDERTAASIGQQGDVMTDPAWRRRGLVMRLAAVCAEETRRLGWPLNWGFPNRQSASVFLKVGWRSVGRIRPLDFYFRADGAACRERFREGRLRAALLPLARTRCAAGRRSLAARAGGAGSVQELERFPEEVGELSRRVERGFPFMVRRDAAYLQWRFLETPSRRHRALGVFDRTGRLAGYTVVQPPAPGSALGHVVDLLAPEPAVLATALEAGLAALEAAGAALARAWAVDGSWWAGELRSAGFLAPKPENHLFVYTFVQDESHPLARHAGDASTWYLTDGDRDDELMG